MGSSSGGCQGGAAGRHAACLGAFTTTGASGIHPQEPQQEATYRSEAMKPGREKPGRVLKSNGAICLRKVSQAAT